MKCESDASTPPPTGQEVIVRPDHGMSTRAVQRGAMEGLNNVFNPSDLSVPDVITISSDSE